MKGEHLRAFLWLRWRIRLNQLKRGGLANAIVFGIVAVFLILFGIGMFVGFLLVGVLALPNASPPVLMYIWDGLLAVFLFSWAIGILTELQRSESLSLDKFLHLPVSLTGAFAINYLSSLLSLTLILFVPAMIGFCFALVFAKGPALLLMFPLLAALLLMVTAVTYQFRSWLAAMMVNPRRRRTVIVVVTMSFILICQLPNMINLMRPWQKFEHNELTTLLAQEQEESQRAETAPGTAAERLQRAQEIRQKYSDLTKEASARRVESNRADVQQIEQTFRIVNLCLPPGWLPVAAMDLAEGNALVALLGTMGLSLIGTLSLWRSYRTTVRLYTGQFSSGERTKTVVVAAPVPIGNVAPTLLEKRLPWLSEQTTAIALGGFRSLTRAPEAKMMLLSPIILVLVFGSMILTHSFELPESVRPLLPFAAFSVTLLSLIQMIGNQFGFDRSGFRVFVLCPAPRRDILLGKNLAFAPLALMLGLGLTVIIHVMYPMRIDHFLALLPVLVCMFLLYCLLANCLSIMAPLPIAAGSLKPTNPKLIPILLQIVFLMILPMVLAPTLLPLGIEVLLDHDALDVVHGVPLALILSLLECVGVVYFYLWVVKLQGQWLHLREQKILEIVTTKAE